MRKIWTICGTCAARPLSSKEGTNQTFIQIFVLKVAQGMARI